MISILQWCHTFISGTGCKCLSGSATGA